MARITVDIVASTGTFSTDLARASRDAKKAAKQMEDDFRRLGLAIGTGLAAGVTALAALTKQSIDTAGALFEMSQKVGVSVEALSTLKFAASQSGVSVEQLQAGLVKLSKNASDASQGIGAAKDAFAALGISVTNTDGSLKNSEALLKETASEFAKYEDGANKTALAVAIFGKAGAELIPMLNEGEEGIRKLQERAKSLGLEISTNTARQAEEFGDNLEVLSMVAQGFGNDLMTRLLPTMLDFTTALTDNATEARAGSQAADILATGFKGVGLAAIVVKNLVEQLTVVVAGFADSAVAVAKFAQDLNPATMAARALKGEIKPIGESFDELKGKLTAIGSSVQTGVNDSFADMLKAFVAFKAPAREVNDELEKVKEKAKGAAPAIRNLAKEQADAAAAAKEEEKALKALEKEWDAYAAIIEGVAQDHRDMAAAQAEQQANFDQQASDLEKEIALLGLSGKAYDRAAIALDAERMARDRNGKVIESQRKKMQGLLTEYAKAQKIKAIVVKFETTGLRGIVNEIEALQEAFDPKHLEAFTAELGNLRQQMVEGIVGTSQDALQSIQSMASEGSDAFKSLQVAIDALTVVQAISAILNQGNGDPYTAFARMAAMAAAVGQLVGSIGSFGGGGGPSSNSAAFRQERQGTGTVLGDMDAKSESIANAIQITADATSALVGISRGMLIALQEMKAAIGGASNMLARGAGDVPSAVAGSSGIFANIFGGKESLRDQGIRIVGGALSDMIDSIMVESYQTIHRSGGWFSSSRDFDRVTDITDEVGDQFSMVIGAIADSVRSGALALGLLPAEIEAALEAFRIEEIRISLKDLTAEEQQAEIEAVFSSIFDGLAGSVVPFIAQFQQVGEGLGETLVRVATGVQVMQEAVLQLGFSLDETRPEQFAQISEGLIEMAGGLDAFISGMQTFVANFASEEHKFQTAQRELTSAFEQAGLTIPETRDGMWELMQSLDATTAAGRQQIATLLRLAGVADEYYSSLEGQAEAAQEAAEAAEQAWQDIRDAVGAYADFIGSFADDMAPGSEYATAMRGISRAFQENIDQANALARAAGLVGAREEDLAGIYARRDRQIAELVAGLSTTVVEQIASLYGDRFAEQLAAIDKQIEANNALRNSGPMGLVVSLANAPRLDAERARLQAQIDKQNAALQEAERQTQALDLAQNLADLALARGVTFEDLAREFGLDMTLFGNDLGLTTEGISELISTLQADTVTALTIHDEVSRIVDAILYEANRRENIEGGMNPGKPEFGNKEPGLAYPKDGEITRGEDLLLIREELQFTREENAAMRAEAQRTNELLAEILAEDRLSRRDAQTRPIIEERNGGRTVPRLLAPLR